MITLTLTYPPSANRLWRTVKGRMIKSAHYRAWLKANARVGLATIEGPYELHLTVTAPDKRVRDIDNLPKAINDCLQAIGAVSNDSNTKRMTIEWGDAPEPGVDVVITPYQREAS